MIKLTTGNLLKAEAEALVNTVNCVGYMGKGIALQFKKAFPENFTAYQKACQQKEVVPGRMFVHDSGDMLHSKVIINFPTKRHWRNNSRMEDVESGLMALVEEVKNRNIKSIAIPPLGCGLGGLQWSEVKPKIEAAFADLPGVEVLLFEPKGAPVGKEQIVGTSKPKMTRAQAILILLMSKYHEYDYRLTLLEIHKLAYLLQEQGEPLSLKYKAHYYGPYATNLRFLLQKMEGHFIRGIGDDEKPDQEVELLPEGLEAANQFLQTHAESKARLASVARLIDGFETPYGMELLSSVHWVSTRQKAETVSEVLEGLKGWSDRKAKMFKPFHIEAALAQLGQ